VIKTRICKAQEVDWIEAPEHYSAFPTLRVNEYTESRHFDFRISSYQLKGYCAVHVHKHAENIYYILKGEKVVELDGKGPLVGPGHVIFILPKVKRAIINTGFEADLHRRRFAPSGYAQVARCRRSFAGRCTG
jgi:mannose-6-phosphate isomerase-like protein (cupin superfamily)